MKDILRYGIFWPPQVDSIVADFRICRVRNTGRELLAARHHQVGASPYETYSRSSHVGLHRSGADRVEILF